MIFNQYVAVAGRTTCGLLLITNGKSHVRFRLVPESTTFSDLERPLRVQVSVTLVSLLLVDYDLPGTNEIRKAGALFS